MNEPIHLTHPADLDIQTVRSRLLNIALFYFAVIAPLSLVISGTRIFTSGWHPIYAFHAGLAVFIITIAAFRKRLSYNVRAYCLLLPVFLLGAMGLFTFGMVGSGFLILFSFAILMAIAFGTRAGLIACAIDIGIMVAAGILVRTGAITPHFDIAEYVVSTNSWASKSVAFFMFAPVTILALGVVYNHLAASLQDLKESEKKYRTLFDSANDAIFLMENDHFVDCNTRTLEMFGVARDQVIGQTPYRFSPEQQPGGRSSKLAAMEKIQAALQGIPQLFEWRHCRYDGTPFFAEISLTDMQVGEKPYILAIVRDISERKELEEEKKKSTQKLQQAQKMEAIGTLAGGIAHDFNNILSSVLGFAELVKMDIPGQDTESLENIESVIKAGLRAKELVRHILTFSRSSEAKKVPVIVSILVKEVVKMLKATLPASIETKVSINTDDGTVFGDTAQIQQVVMNLCVNAAHAMQQDGGVLTVRIEDEILGRKEISGYEEMEPGKYLRLTVSDTGHGIPEEIINRIFDPFYTTKTRGEGTGMGLSVVHGIVKEMNGAIHVESTPGKGTAFHVLLPVYEGTQTQESDAAKQELQKGIGRILFVDDETAITDAVGKTLARLGYDVKAVIESLDALEMFADDPDAFDLVITDMDMPKMNGLELSKRMLKKKPDLPIIICTGSPQTISPQALNDIGIHKMVVKPIHLADLSDLVKSAMALGKKEG